MMSTQRPRHFADTVGMGFQRRGKDLTGEPSAPEMDCVCDVLLFSFASRPVDDMLDSHPNYYFLVVVK